jgi:Acetyltransferase (GNAT) domain
MDLHILEVSDPRWLQTLRSLRHDIYQLPGYVSVEAKRTGTVAEAIVVAEGDKIMFIPYLLRHCDPLTVEESTPNSTSPSTQPLLDALSPYGYPGVLLSESAVHTPGFADGALQAVKQALYEKGVCSLFLRLHPILNQEIEALFAPEFFTANGRTVAIDLTLSEAQLWNHTKPDHRNKINRCRHLGLTARMVPVPDLLESFIEIYQDTMQRVEATAGYLEFDHAYFLQLYEALGDMLHLCVVEQDNQIISAGLYTECNGIVQAIFGGTLTNFLKLSPTTLETDYVRHWAKARGNQWLHLGGG